MSVIYFALAAILYHMLWENARGSQDIGYNRFAWLLQSQLTVAETCRENQGVRVDGKNRTISKPRGSPRSCSRLRMRFPKAA